jgi:hypothetical protein
MSRPPLWRNRDFVLLEAGQLLSGAGTQLTAIAYPLLVIAATHSPIKAGLVSFARLVPHAMFGLLAGVAADRWNRRRIMIAADGVRALALAGLVVSITLRATAFWPIAIVAFFEGTGSAFFAAAQAGALRSVVPAGQLPAAVGAQSARHAMIGLIGPPLGGMLFGLGRVIPFLADVVSYSFSLVSLVAMRTPFQEARAADPSPLRAQVAEGFRFLWSRPFLRTCAFLYGLSNLLGQGLLFAVVVIGGQEGLAGGQIGALTGMFAAGLLVGSLLSPVVRRSFSVRTVLRLELWAWLGCAAFVVWPSVYVLAAGLLPVALAIPATDSVVVSYRLAMTPDRLLGRVESARSTISLLVSPLGPLAAGALLASLPARTAIVVVVGFALILAMVGTLSRSIRSAPSLDEIDGVAGTGGGGTIRG